MISIEFGTGIAPAPSSAPVSSPCSAGASSAVRWTRPGSPACPAGQDAVIGTQ